MIHPVGLTSPDPSSFTDAKVSLASASAAGGKKPDLVLPRIARLPVPARPHAAATPHHLSKKLPRPPDAYRTVAVERRAEGVHLYTYVEGGRLLHYCWLIERQTRGEDGGWSTYAFLLPTRPSYLITLRILSREAADCTFKPYAGSYTTHGEVAGARQAYVTFGSNGPSRHVIEKVGFQQ